MVAVGAGVSVVAACGGTESDDDTAAARAAPPADGGYHECPVGGTLRRETVRRKNDVAVGPMIFRSAEFRAKHSSAFDPISPRSDGVREHPRLRPAAEAGELFPVDKQIVIVEGSQDVVIAVADDNPRPAALFYGRRASGASQATVGDGSQAVHFEACDRLVGYPGGILSAGPQCVTLEVWVTDEEGQPPREARLPFGASCEEG